MRKESSVLVVGLNYWPETTGIAPYTHGLAAGLADRGHRVRVLTTFAHYPQWSFSDDQTLNRATEVSDGVRIDRFRHRLPSQPIGLARLLSELSFGWRAVRTRWGKPDAVVVVSPALFASALAVLRAKLLRKPLVAWVQDLYSLGLSETGNGGRAGRALVRAVERFVLRNSSKVVVIHDRFRAEVSTSFGVPLERIEVVRNWSHLIDDVDVDRKAARKEFGWGAEEVIALHAGNMGVKQGLENLVAAAKLADEQHSTVRFVLLGDGNQRDALVEAARGIRRIQFIESLPDDAFRRALQSADVLIVNEKRGISGMAVPSKLTSYFSTGLPVVASTDPGSVTEREVLAAGAGVTVPAGDGAALLRAVENVVADPSRAAAYGASAKEFRATELSAEAAITRYAQLLSDLS